MLSSLYENIIFIYPLGLQRIYPHDFIQQLCYYFDYGEKFIKKLVQKLADTNHTFLLTW